MLMLKGWIQKKLLNCLKEFLHLHLEREMKEHAELLLRNLWVTLAEKAEGKWGRLVLFETVAPKELWWLKQKQLPKIILYFLYFARAMQHYTILYYINMSELHRYTIIFLFISGFHHNVWIIEDTLSFALLMISMITTDNQQCWEGWNVLWYRGDQTRWSNGSYWS